jgi:hypothetical protein
MGYLLWRKLQVFKILKKVNQLAPQVFKKVEKQLPQLTTLDLQYVSPSLLKARNLDLAVPGTSGSLSLRASMLTLRQEPIRVAGQSSGLQASPPSSPSLRQNNALVASR